jgi:hypothetical protein
LSCLTKLKFAQLSLTKAELASNVLETLLESSFDAGVGLQANVILEDLTSDDNVKGSVRLQQADRVLLLQNNLRTLLG